jgi:hypothetical protein
LELSPASMSALFTERLSLGTLAASRTALRCTPNDLFDVDTLSVAVAKPARKAETSAESGPRGIDAAV